MTKRLTNSIADASPDARTVATDGRVHAAYAYDGDRETNLTVTLPGGGTFARTLTRDACRPSLVTGHGYAFNGSPVLWNACGRDILGRVTNVMDSASMNSDYERNGRGEITGADIGVAAT